MMKGITIPIRTINSGVWKGSPSRLITLCQKPIYLMHNNKSGKIISFGAADVPCRSSAALILFGDFLML